MRLFDQPITSHHADTKVQLMFTSNTRMRKSYKSTKSTWGFGPVSQVQESNAEVDTKTGQMKTGKRLRIIKILKSDTSNHATKTLRSHPPPF